MSIASDDRGFTLGHGLFETILFEGGTLQDWDAHLARLVRGCAVLGLPAPDLAAAEHAALAVAGTLARAAVRLTWSAGPGDRGLDPPAEPTPRLTITAAPAPLPPGPASLVTAQVRRNDQSPASRLKTLSYLDNVLARAEARAAGVDEALMLNTRGEVACAAAANLFWVKDGVLFTPDLDCGVLDGVRRAKVLRAAIALGVVIGMVRGKPQDLQGASVFLTNSLIGIRPVSRLDGVDLPPSPLVARLT
jgi:branched-subunit amino acid aminotransferase/4-amino-4-deoxychorismate lyase